MRAGRLQLVVAALALLCVVLLWLFGVGRDLPQPPTVLPALTPAGAVSTPPFGTLDSRAVAPAPTTQPSLDDLKRKYFALHDRAARFALLKDRKESEAQYLAYRAFHECGRVMSSLQDGNDLAYTMRQLWAEQGVSNRVAREAALKDWTSACSGFLRPNPDVKREAEALARQAVAAGHVGARALAFDFAADTDAATVAALARAVVESGEPLTLFDGYDVMLRARQACGGDPARVEREYIAWILAACRVNDCYRTDLFFGLC